MGRLTAFVCAHNEETNLAQCLERLRFADEIVVLLDRCTDGSEAVAHKLADRVICGSFPLEGPRRMAALASCGGDWILEIDADELLPVALAEEIQTLLQHPCAADWFLLPVDNFVGNRLVRHGWGGSFGTTAVARLYRRGCKSWGMQRVHPTVQMLGRSGGLLKNAILHQVDASISDMILRLDRYTKLRAMDLRATKVRPSLPSNLFRGFRRFIKCYVRRRGYREGGWGLLIALMAALYPILSVLRARLEPSNPTEFGETFASKPPDQ